MQEQRTSERVVAFSAEQHDLAFRAALKEAKDQLERAVETFQDLWDAAGDRVAGLSDDAQGQAQLLREDLDLLDAIGWPETVLTERR
jgi:hypothetical protein